MKSEPFEVLGNYLVYVSHLDYSLNIDFINTLYTSYIILSYIVKHMENHFYY